MSIAILGNQEWRELLEQENHRAMAKIDDAQPDPVDAALAAWRQGDCVLGEHWFAYLGYAATEQGTSDQNDASEKPTLLEWEVLGFVILTQSCDIVRRASERPYVEVAPLVPVRAEDLPMVRNGRRPQYAMVPGVAEKNIVADLDRVMTIAKSVVATWERTVGCRTDVETRDFANALARKRARFAFPDEFVRFSRKLQARLQDKHDKDSPEGEALRGLREIRVRAAPDWKASEIELTFWFILEGSKPSDEKYATALQVWLDQVQATGRFKMVNGSVVRLEDLRASDYVESDPLDLDYLSADSEL